MIRFVIAFLCLLVSVQGISTPRPLVDVPVPIGGGKTIRLNQYRGKALIAALISTTCDHCVSSLLLLGKLQKEYGPKGFQVVAIAADKGAEAKVGDFARLQLGFPVGYFSEDVTMQVFDFKRGDSPFVPMFMFVDKKGTVRFQYAGKDDFFKNEEKNTRILIEALLKE